MVRVCPLRALYSCAQRSMDPRPPETLRDRAPHTATAEALSVRVVRCPPQPAPHPSSALVRAGRSIPLRVPHEGATRDAAAGLLKNVEVVGYRPPSDAEWFGRSPVHRSEPSPTVWNGERFHYVSLVAPSIEECTLNDRPISV